MMRNKVSLRIRLKECKTGVDRIAAPLLDKEGVVIAHKTGSGYVNEMVFLQLTMMLPIYVCLIISVIP